ncbi:hypothetical protein GCM10025777_25800 [Membranihabitans marinus]
MADWDVVAFAGLNALDQNSNREEIIPKSALGFQFGLEATTKQKFYYKGGISYQFHEILDIKNRQSSVIANIETTGRRFQRLKLSGGVGLQCFAFDYLKLGVNNSLGYNINFYDEDESYLEFLNSIELQYLSNITEIYIFIKRLKIAVSLEGNLISFGNKMDMYQSKIYAMNFGYSF